MPDRRRNYQAELRARNQRAWAMGYRNYTQRRRILEGANVSEREAARRLEPQIRELEQEGDYASMGMIFQDVYNRLRRESGNWEEEREETTAFLRQIISPTAA